VVLFTITVLGCTTPLLLKAMDLDRAPAVGVAPEPDDDDDDDDCAQLGGLWWGARGVLEADRRFMRWLTQEAREGEGEREQGEREGEGELRERAATPWVTNALRDASLLPSEEHEPSDRL
jgi:hypothetical protein